MMTEALEEDEGYVMRPKDQRQQRRRRGLDDDPKESTTTTETLKQEDEHKDYNNDNVCAIGGYKTRPRD